MKFLPFILVAALVLVVYFKPWRQKSKELPLTDDEKREIDYLVHGEQYPYSEALEIVLKKRLENKGVSGWAI